MEFVEAGKLKALMFQKIDLLEIYRPVKPDKDEAALARFAVLELQALVRAAMVAGCDICLSEITVRADSVSGEFDSSVWADNESIDHIDDLGNTWSEQKLRSRSSNSTKADRQSSEANITDPGSGANGGTPTPTTLVNEKGGRTIELLPDGTTLCFTKYQQEPFELSVGTTASLKHSTVQLLNTGRLLYTFDGEGKPKPANVPLGAKPGKFWCENCGSLGRCGLEQHTISEE